MFNPQAVSEMLRIPPSSLRRYADLYRDHMSESAQVKGRKRRYTDRDLAVIQKIRQLSAQKVPPEEIARQLQVVKDLAPQEGSVLLNLPAVQEELEAIRAAVAAAQAQNQQINERLAALEQSERSKDEIIQLQNERLAALEEYARAPWWKRLLGREP